MLNKYNHNTQNFDVFCTSWMKSLIKCESGTIDQNVLSREEEKGLIIKDPLQGCIHVQHLYATSHYLLFGVQEKGEVK